MAVQVDSGGLVADRVGLPGGVPRALRRGEALELSVGEPAPRGLGLLRVGAAPVPEPARFVRVCSQPVAKNVFVIFRLSAQLESLGPPSTWFVSQSAPS
jgi:hypothetical protein